MQTFLPYRSFERSARCLDNRRLGKQRVEAMQILNVLLGRQTAWANHPAVLQWKGYEGALFLYLRAMCEEWRRRGYSNEKLDVYTNSVRHRKCLWSGRLPPWLGSTRFHRSHKSRLLQKDWAWYEQFKWRVPLDLEYYWPVRKGGAQYVADRRRRTASHTARGAAR